MLKLKDLKPSEKEITREVRAYLDIKGIPHFKKLQGLGSPKGIFDIIGCYKSKFLAIEIKREGKQLSFAQEVFQMEYRQAGGICLVVSSVQQLEEELNEFDKKSIK